MRSACQSVGTTRGTFASNLVTPTREQGKIDMTNTNDVTRTLIATSGKICGKDYQAHLRADIPNKGEVENLTLSIAYEGEDYILSASEILSHILERGVTRNTNDNNKTVADAIEYLGSNSRGYLSPAREKIETRPVPVVTPKGRKGKADLQEQVVSWLELHERHTSAGEDAYKAIKALPANVWTVIVGDPDKCPSYVTEAIEAIEDQAKRDQEAREKAAMEALASL